MRLTRWTPATGAATRAMASSALAGMLAMSRGNALLQQQFAGGDHRLDMEPPPHQPVLQGVGDGDDGHALVMRHVAVHHRHPLAGLDARRR